MKIVVDRIEKIADKNEYFAVCEFTDKDGNKEMRNISTADLPNDVKEGDALELCDGVFCIKAEKSALKKLGIRERFNRLIGKI